MVALHEKACAYGIPGVEVDGNDVLTVRDAVREAVERARTERMPTLMNIKSYRLKGHSVVDPDRYRSEEYLRARFAPRTRCSAWPSGCKHERRHGRRGAGQHRRRGRARGATRPSSSPTRAPSPIPTSCSSSATRPKCANQPSALPGQDAMGIVTYRQALHDTLAEEMRRDPSVVLLGEEIGKFEGSYKITAGLLKEFGAERVMDTPIAEEGFVGAAIGAAMLGLRPVVEIMTVNFSLLALDQMVNHAAKIHYMFGGQARVPMVLRTPEGGGQQLAATHSQNFSSWYAYVPGLKVVAPATPADARGLLKAAIRDDDPVDLSGEPGALQHQGRGARTWATTAASANGTADRGRRRADRHRGDHEGGHRPDADRATRACRWSRSKSRGGSRRTRASRSR